MRILENPIHEKVLVLCMIFWTKLYWRKLNWTRGNWKYWTFEFDSLIFKQQKQKKSIFLYYIPTRKEKVSLSTLCDLQERCCYIVFGSIRKIEKKWENSLNHLTGVDRNRNIESEQEENFFHHKNIYNLYVYKLYIKEN